MRKKIVIVILALVGVGFAAWALFGQNRKENTARQNRNEAISQVERSQPPLPKETVQRVPAHYESAPSMSALGPILPHEQFTGQTREAYRVVKEIPQTIAQLPCYCHCDTSIGHKSLYSCFEDNHAAQCAVCVGEALTAYKLQKEQRLSAPEIRKRIIAEYSKL